VHKPANTTFEEAAAVPVAAVTALQALRDKGEVQPGQRVLINGASGGVGTFAVQLAKAFGAEVTGVCSTRNVDLVGSLGADRVIDYTREDFTRSGERYDLMLDIPANRSWSELKQVLTDHATYVMVGGPKENRWIASFGLAIRRRLVAVPGSRRVVAPFLASIDKPPLVVLAELIEAGKVRPAIERRYAFSELPEALAYVGQGHAQAKVIVTVDGGVG
jgi:NADPH:quinone reductase-like Zn-dependent oxidoreductase